MTLRTVGISAIGDPAFADGVTQELRSLHPAIHIKDVRNAEIAWIDGGDSDSETILKAIRKVSRPVLSAYHRATCERVAAANVARVVCCVGGSGSTDGVLDIGGSDVIPSLQSSRENRSERRMAKILSRIAQGFDAPSTSPVDWPIEAMVEVVRTCNLRCPLCPVGNGTATHYENMSVATFREIALALGETVTSLSLYNYGEPLLHPNIDKIVAVAKSASIERVTITTNGTLLRPGLEFALIRAGLDAIRISIDGATQESYEKYRVGGNLEKVWTHVRRLVAARDEIGSDTPRIEVQFIVNRWNESEIDEFRCLADAAGVDRVRLKTFNALMTGAQFSEAGRDFLPSDPRYSRYADPVSLEYRDRYKLAQCEWPRNRIVVNADATVVPCCYDYNGRHRLGTFRNVANGEWWTTPQRTRFREQLQSDPMSIDMCSICPVGVPNLDVTMD